jgi:hypothetical protein
METINDDDLRLLSEVVWMNKPSLMSVARQVGVKILTEGEREELREVLADELCSKGLRADNEPNERGLRLDSIIGKLMFY